MNATLQNVDSIKCPICGKSGFQKCAHFMGWTNDGRTMGCGSGEYVEEIPENAVIVKTGVSARVYCDVR